MSPQPVQTVPITLGGKQFHLLWGPAARYHLQRWGMFDSRNTPNLAYAAAMAGTLDAKGNWVSAGINHPLDLAPVITVEEENSLYAACMEAIKNTQPATVTTETKPEEEAPA